MYPPVAFGNISKGCTSLLLDLPKTFFACALSWSQSPGTSLSVPVLCLITLMVPATILLLFYTSFFCIFLLVSCGLSTININNLGNCLLLLTPIPVLLLLSAGPGPKNRYDRTQTKQAKWNESRGKRALHPSPPHEFRWGCPNPKKHEHQIPVPFFFKALPHMLWSWCWKNSASMQKPQKVHATHNAKPLGYRQMGLTQWEIHRSVPLRVFT